jgi:hypothetical protein
VGRHTQPGTGTPEPDTGFWVRLAAGAVAVLLVGGWWLASRDDDEPVRTASPGSSSSSSTASDSSSPSPSPTSASASASPTARPPTLSFVVRRNSYITVRVPGGRTLVSKLFKPGAERSFDNKVLQVVNGRPTAVRFTVNGKPRKPGPAEQPETFTVRRR